MGQSIPHALGRERQVAATLQSTNFTTIQKHVAADCLIALNSSVSFKKARDDRDDAKQTRSLMERTTGKEECNWSCETYLIPNAPGTAPDCGALLKNAFGAEAVSAGTSVAYSLTDAQGTQKAMTFSHEYSGIVLESAVGALVDNWKLSISGGERPKMMFDGPAAYGVRTSYLTLKNTVTTSATIEVTATDQAAIQVDSMITIGADTNTGAGYQVIGKAAKDTITVVDKDLSGGAVVSLYWSDGDQPMQLVTLTEGVDFVGLAAATSPAAATNLKNAIDALERFSATVVSNVVTVTPNAGTHYYSKTDTAPAITVDPEWQLTLEGGASVSQSAGVVIAPFFPTASTSGSVVSGIKGDLNIEAVPSSGLSAVSLKITSFEITNTNQWSLVNDETFEASATDAIEGDRSVKGTISVRARRDQLIYLQSVGTHLSRNLTVDFGNSSTSRYVRVSVPLAEFEFSDLEIPQKEAGTYNLPFTALGSSGGDELTVTFF